MCVMCWCKSVITKMSTILLMSSICKAFAHLHPPYQSLVCSHPRSLSHFMAIVHLDRVEFVQCMYIVHGTRYTSMELVTLCLRLFIEQTLLPMALSGYIEWQEALLTANLMTIVSERWAKSISGCVPAIMKKLFFLSNMPENLVLTVAKWRIRNNVLKPEYRHNDPSPSTILLC